MPLYQGSQRKLKEGLAYLHGLGAWMVLCRGKVPLPGSRWRTCRPDLDSLLAHPDTIGLVPFSVSTSALDVDEGNPAALALCHPPLVSCSSRRPGGEHLYYRDDIPRSNRRWAAFGCSGEVRSNSGYLILHGDAPMLLAEALANVPNVQWECKFPAHILEGDASDDVRRASCSAAADPADPQRILPPLPPGAPPELEQVQKGRRNIALFDALRFWAYEEVKLAAASASYDAWRRSVEHRALAENARFPQPLTERHALSTAHSVAVWTWTAYRSGRGRGWTTEQRRRGGENRGRRTRFDNRERDSEIVRRWEGGESLRQISRAIGLSHVAVRKIVKRDGFR